MEEKGLIFRCFASGSSGNCYYLGTRTSGILIDAGISARLINIHTIKPIDRDIIIKAAKETGRIITVEEHNVVGGLADAVCEVVTAECPVKVTRIGVQDEFGHSGPAWELLDEFKLTQPHIANVIREVVKEK